MKIRLLDIAHARSGDKGDTANVGVIALRPEWYPVLVEYVTRDAVREHFRDEITGDVDRFELPNLGAINFLLHGALGGGGTVSLKTDAQGKVYSTALLRMTIEVPDADASELDLPGAGPVTPITTAKVALTVIAAVLFALGMRTEYAALRWAAVAFLTAAVLLRFLDRPRRDR